MTESATLRTRRSLLAAAAGSAAALAATAAAPSAIFAVDPNDLVLNQDNPTTTETGVTQTTDDLVGFRASTTNGIGLKGVSTSLAAYGHQAIGVMGVYGTGVEPPTPPNRVGVFGFASDSDATDGLPTGVVGHGMEGVRGRGGVGVRGEGDEVGVFAATSDTAETSAIALWSYATSIKHRALKVEGRAEFTRSGRSYVATGASSRTVYLTGVTSSSLVFAVLSTSRSGIFVRAVMPATGRFVVALNAKVPGTTYFSWIVFTNPANHGG
jgi:hypothetical protein